MKLPHLTGIGLCIAAGLATPALADEPAYSLVAGPAFAQFHAQSTDLSGPPGTTPPGATIGVKDLQTLAIEASKNLGHGWSVSLAFGVPPKATFTAQGSAAALGSVGSARAWFPALLATYRFGAYGGVRPYVGGGVNYTFYTDTQIGENFTQAFGGTSSTGKLKASFGPVVKAGVEVPLMDAWFMTAGYTRYGIRTRAEVTTQTPGVGAITRKLTLRSDPGVWTVMIGRSF